MSYRIASLVASVSLLAAASAAAQPTPKTVAEAPTFVPVSSASLTWSPIQPAGFDKGTEIAVVRGDPAAAGEPYVIRLRFPAGYRFPPHWHPVTENLTVLEGRFLLAMGERANEAQLKTYLPGDYLFIEGKHPHFGGAVGPTTIQLHGTGPFSIVVVGSPEDKR